MKTRISRRRALEGAAAVAGGLAVAGHGRGALGQTATEQPAVLIVYLIGGYNALFGSADSFVPAGTFGCTSTNVMSLGNGLVIDRATFGTNLPAIARSNLASIGVRHGITSHPAAQMAAWNNGTRNYALMLANAMGGNAPIRCAVVGPQIPPGPTPAEGAVSLQVITDMRSTINALGGGTADSTTPSRAITAAALTLGKNTASGAFTANPNSLRTLKEGYDATIATMNQPQAGFNFTTLAQAYGVGATDTQVNSWRKQMLAAELMIQAGAKVVIAMNGGWDTHNDTTGTTVRNKMNGTILPPLATFVGRMMAATGRNVTTVIYGDFARSLPGSDHARSLSVTVMGKKVRVGTTGRVNAQVDMTTTAKIPQLYSFLAAVSKAPNNPFGTNPHSALVLP